MSKSRCHSISPYNRQLISGIIASLQLHSTRAFEMLITRFQILKESRSRSSILSPERRNTHSETVRAEDRAVTETIARSRAPCLYPSLSGSSFLSRALPPSHANSLSSRRTFSISLARTDGIRKNVLRSFPLFAVSPPAASILLTFSLFFPPPLHLSLVLSRFFLIYRPSPRSHASSVPFHLTK